MKKVISLTLMAVLIATIALTAACAKSAKSGGLVGTWGMVDNPTKTIKISMEGGQYFYEGSQGKSPAQKQDDNTLLVPMGPIQVTVKFDPATNILNVSFMGESYKYKRVQ